MPNITFLNKSNGEPRSSSWRSEFAQRLRASRSPELTSLSMRSPPATRSSRRRKPPHGNWLAWLKRECDLSEDKAERYMQIARGRAKLEANSARLRNLSLSNALRVIKKSEPPGSKSSRPAAKTKKHATSLDALGWWSGASLEERRHFLEGVGVSQVVGHLSAVRLLDLLEGRLERDGINAAAPLKKLRELVDRSKTTLDLKALPAQGVA